MKQATNKTDIGVWFITYNNEKMWSNNFGTGNPIRYRTLLSEQPNTFGIPDSGKIEDIDFQLLKLAELGVDFILYDITNGGLTPELNYGKGNEWIVDNALLTCQRLAKWNQEHSHKIRYASTVTGDANLDFIADATDFNMICEKLLGRWTSYIFDVRYDSVIDVKDLVLIKKQL